MSYDRDFEKELEESKIQLKEIEKQLKEPSGRPSYFRKYLWTRRNQLISRIFELTDKIHCKCVKCDHCANIQKNYSLGRGRSVEDIMYK